MKGYRLKAVFLIFFACPLVCPAKLAQGCFNFDQPRKTPLQTPIPLSAKQGDNFAAGELKSGIDWGATRAIVEQPIKVIYKKLLNHETVKDMSRTDLQTIVTKKPGYLEFHNVDVTVRIVAFLKISWQEEWGYQLIEGTPEDPKKILIQYQKAGGTRHIRHLCGSFILSSLGPAQTDVYLYEQIKASRRSAEDTMRMTLGILRTIRKGY